MTFICPVCGSSAVDHAGQTATYASIICRDCESWSTIPIEPEPMASGTAAPLPDPQSTPR